MTPPRFVSEYQQEHEDDIQELKRAAQELASVAETVKEVAERTTEALGDSALSPSVLLAPRSGLAMDRKLLSALTNGRGLGFAVTGGRQGTLFGGLGRVIGRGNLFTEIMVTSLKLRLDALRLAHPELTGDPKLTRFVEAVYADEDIEATRALWALFRDSGFIGALSRLAPAANELFALKGLQDENPFNDAAAWRVATERSVPKADLLLGVPAKMITRWERGDGAAGPVDASDYEARALQKRGTMLDFLRNINLLGNDGRILIQTIAGPDGVERYVVQAPGARPGPSWNTSPQDFVGALHSLAEDRSSYPGALKSAIDQYGVPEGAEIALVGHSAGGIAGMILAQEASFCRRYKVTHAISVGSPISYKRCADTGTKVISVVNQHDLFTMLDGVGAGSCADPPSDWYVVEYTEPTHLFPDCHSPAHYLNDLEHLLVEPRTYIDEQLQPYDGEVVRSQLYQTYDDAPKPSGYPFLAVPTQRIDTAAGAAELPVTCTGGDGLAALFAADAGAARSLLSGLPVGEPLRIGPGKVVVALVATDCRRGSLGAFQQVAACVLVRGPWTSRWPPVTEFLRRGDLRGVGVHPFGTVVTTDEIDAVNRDVWGHPSQIAHVEVQVSRLRFAVRASSEAGRLLRLEGLLGPGVPSPGHDLVVYSRRGTSVLRSVADLRGPVRVYPMTTAKLKLGQRRERLVALLHELGLNGQRPLACLSIRGFQARLGAGAEVQWVPEDGAKR
ncbi:hypothetical protein [Actinomadura rubrisoli]|uniref:hypothetical protein n=1 Tax=Actinomadura rubrisoli TaxID=2530368 RepID=UPI001404FAFB|nr:hypothetical protein [Actinomadura rubrisoli]